MSLWDRIRTALGWRGSPAPEAQHTPSGAAPRKRPAPVAPTLAEMRALLRAGMSRDEFFAVLDDLAMDRGLRVSLPSADERLVGLPVAEGGELLCFLPEGVLNYVEYQGDVFLEVKG